MLAIKIYCGRKENKNWKRPVDCGEGSYASDIVLTCSTCPRETEGYARKMTTTGYAGGCVFSFLFF